MQTKRTQIIFNIEQFGLLSSLSKRKGQSISELVRNAVDKFYLERERKRMDKVVKRLISKNLPVSDWKQMKDEITKGSLKQR